MIKSMLLPLNDYAGVPPRAETLFVPIKCFGLKPKDGLLGNGIIRVPSCDAGRANAQRNLKSGCGHGRHLKFGFGTLQNKQVINENAVNPKNPKPSKFCRKQHPFACLCLALNRHYGDNRRT